MESYSIPFDYITVEGPEGLKNALYSLWEQVQNNPASAAEQHYYLYRLGGQKSFIKVDASRQPFYFWYYDLLGRPITRNVKDVIAEFLWEKCGERERYMAELETR